MAMIQARTRVVLATVFFLVIIAVVYVLSRKPVVSWQGRMPMAPEQVRMPEAPQQVTGTAKPSSMVPNNISENFQDMETQNNSRKLSAREYCEQESNITEDCLDMMFNKTAFVIGISSNHFKEAHNLIGSIEREMPGAKIILYDLGLTASQQAVVRKMCNVELRTFNFDIYPDHVSPKQLTNFAWKPLLVHKIGLEYEIIVYTDSSIRFKTSVKQHVFPYILKANVSLLGLPAMSPTTNIAQYTEDETIAYLNLTREELTELPQIQGGFLVVWMTDATVRKILDDWVDCALHQECIAPVGASVWGPGNCGPKIGGPQVTLFSGCHRFDQSALDLIMYKHCGKGLEKIFRPIAWSTCGVSRGDNRQNLKLKQC